jgi:hypothetical protein
MILAAVLHRRAVRQWRTERWVERQVRLIEHDAAIERLLLDGNVYVKLHTGPFPDDDLTWNPVDGISARLRRVELKTFGDRPDEAHRQPPPAAPTAEPDRPPILDHTPTPDIP